MEAKADFGTSVCNLRIERPTRQDLELSQLWGEGEPGPEEQVLQRMLSARLAERAAARFYASFDLSVVDTAVTQLRDDGVSWKTHDLEVDSRPVDVKNARRWENKFPAHCVPRFKRTRGQEVTIAGVLSDWPSLADLRMAEGRVWFLGETSESHMGNVERQLLGQRLVVNFRRGFEHSAFLPPWVFTYPAALYSSRTHALSTLSEDALLGDARLVAKAGLKPHAIWASAGLQCPSADVDSLSQAETMLRDLLVSRVAALEASLPLIYLTLMEFFLEMLAGGPSGEFSAGRCRGLIFPSKDKTRPLYIYDPLEMTSTLLDTLETLWLHRSRGLGEFKVFELANLNVLQGKRHTGETSWTTLLAYCGGRTHEGYACRRWPLVYGRQSSCPECGRLICPDCGYCSPNCPRVRTAEAPVGDSRLM